MRYFSRIEHYTKTLLRNSMNNPGFSKPKNWFNNGYYMMYYTDNNLIYYTPTYDIFYESIMIDKFSIKNIKESMHQELLNNRLSTDNSWTLYFNKEIPLNNIPSYIIPDDSDIRKQDCLKWRYVPNNGIYKIISAVNIPPDH